jgi:hypothetical protein
VIPVLAFAAAVLIAFVWLKFSPPRSNQNQAATAAPVPALTVASSRVETPAPESNRPAPASQTSAAAGTPAYSEWVQESQAKLLELSASDDPESLRSILSEFSSADPDVRKTAVTAARQFGSRDAIPYLQEAADHTDDAREKVKILDAIDFLKMPSLTELRQVARDGGAGGN